MDKPTTLATIEQQGLAVPSNIDPEAQVAYGQKCAKALMTIINAKQKKLVINGENYIEFEDWQTIARFFNSSVGTDTVKPIQEGGEIVGYTARAIVYNAQGVIIGSAEADCTTSEKNWGNKEMFQVKSMAQTRAAAKALRNVFGWVAVLAGVKATPAEEMPQGDEPFSGRNPKRATVTNPDDLASPAQKNLIKTLCQQKNAESSLDVTTLTKKQASEEIDRLMNLKSA